MRAGDSPSGAVAVLGNGPVGQTTALLLARWGVRVLLLDAREERDRTGSKSICQQRDVLDVWECVGAGRRIADEGVTWTTARTFHRDRELFAYTLPQHAGSCFPPFVNISQARTEEILDETIAAQTLIDVRWGHRVVDVRQAGHAVTVRCETAKGPVEIEAAFAVACAGARADDLRERLGVAFEGQSYDDRFLICDIRASLPGWANERRFYFDPAWNPGRQVLIHPCPASTFRIDWQVPADYDLEGEEASGALDARIRAIVGDKPYEIVWRSVYRFHSRVVDRMRVGRVLLAGDCAHLMAPFGARGLNSGVADAENAAWKIAYVLRGWAPEGLLESYHHERHAAARENLEVTGATMRFLVPHDERDRSRRAETLARAVADPAARLAVDSGRLSEPFWYVDSPLTTPSATRPFAGRPARGTLAPAGPGVIVCEATIAVAGTRGRLRAIARDGFLLIVGPAVDAALVRAAAAEYRGPIRVLALDEIDADGAVRAGLGARADEVWVIRPDAHVAAVLTAPVLAEVTAVLRRAQGVGL